MNYVKKRGVISMVKVKDLATSKTKYTNSADNAAVSYRASIDGIVWKDPAIQGQTLYEQKMADPNVLARRRKKIEKVSDEEFKQSLRDKGANRISAGMKAGANKWEKNWAPYKSALEEVSLPAKTADPVANVQNRVIPIVLKMVEKKNEIG